MPRRSKPNDKQIALALPAEIEALVQAGDSDAADALSAMAESAPHETAKAARRALHRLELRGVRPSHRASNAEARVPVIRDRKHGMDAARMAQSDFSGDRAIAMSRSDRAGHLLEFMINASGTVVKVTDLPIGLDVYAADLPVVLDERLLCAAIPADYARYRIHEAARLTRELNSLRPVGLSRALITVGSCERAYERSLVYEYMDAGTDIDTAPDSKALQRESITIMATFSREGITEFIEASVEVLNSRVVLTDYQRQEELDRVTRPIIDRMMPRPVFEEALRRLEDHALLHYLDGDQATARTVLSHAVQGRRADGPGSWFLARLAGKLVLYHYLRRAADRDGGALSNEDAEDEASAPIIQLPR